MAKVLRWRLQDPSDPSPAGVYTFPRNPHSMTSPFPTKAVTVKGTTAVDGQVLLWEGATEPASWSFTGTIVNAAHYDDLMRWVYERQGRMFLFDHFGRRLIVVLKKFTATPPDGATRFDRYWKHDYTIEALVTAISQPTVGDGGPQ